MVHPTEHSLYFPEEFDSTTQYGAFDQQIADKLFARFAGSSTISFRQASSLKLSQFTTFLNPQYRHPSRETLVKQIREEAAQTVNLIKQLLRESLIVSIS